MAADPKEELSEGLKHCLWFRGPLLMDHLMTLRREVNQLNAPPEQPRTESTSRLLQSLRLRPEHQRGDHGMD